MHNTLDNRRCIGSRCAEHGPLTGRHVSNNIIDGRSQAQHTCHVTLSENCPVCNPDGYAARAARHDADSVIRPTTAQREFGDWS